MNTDFHYYVTYLAARDAGYTDRDALTIAHAAQYVDVSMKKRIDKTLLPDLANPTPTLEGRVTIAGELVLPASQEDRDESEAIWASFHFLPGNFEGKKVYTGHDVLENQSTTEPENKRKFKLLCLPNSELSEKMINDIITDHIDEDYYLHLVGIRMHVLADTWAHAYYVGTQWKFINDVPDGTVYDLNNHERIKSLVLESLTNSNDAYSYLGHGRMGTTPDIPHRNYRYSARWSNIPIVKNNPADYICAYLQMVKAMQLIRCKELVNRATATATTTAAALEAANSYLVTRFDEIIPANQVYITPEIEALIKEEKYGASNIAKKKCLSEKIVTAQKMAQEGITEPVPATSQRITYTRNTYAESNKISRLKEEFCKSNYKEDNAPKIWNPTIKTFYPDVGEGLPAYNNELWLDLGKVECQRGFSHGGNVKTTDYYKFNQAAIIHRDFVRTHLGDNGALPPAKQVQYGQ